jgi:hypothetical protein
MSDTPADIHCESCGYSLAGLPADGSCPECNRDIADSIALHALGTPWQRKPGVRSLWVTTTAMMLRPHATMRRARSCVRSSIVLGAIVVTLGLAVSPLVVALGVLGTAKAPVPLTDLDVAAMAASALAVVGFWLLVMSVESCLVLSARKTVRVAHAVVVVAHAMTVPVLLIVALGALASALSLTADWVAANQSVWALVVCLLVCLVYLPARTFRRGWKGISEAAAQPPATRDEPTGTP